MALILNIDTSSVEASVALAEHGQCLNIGTNNDQRSHAAWIHSAIKTVFQRSSKSMKALDAVAITSGPGSYTGLRVGMATAKGICYALNIPLIAVNTLYAMAASASAEQTDYLCPMMDAGRMEVYTALYNPALEEIIAPAPLILDKSSFSALLSEKTISFFGTGKNKFQDIIDHENAYFPDYFYNAGDFSRLTYAKYRSSEFSSLAYLEPLYLKEYGTRVY